MDFESLAGSKTLFCMIFDVAQELHYEAREYSAAHGSHSPKSLGLTAIRL